MPGALTSIRCIGLLRGSFCRHYDGEPDRRPVYRRLVQEGRLGPDYAVDDGVVLHFLGSELAGVVASRPAARAYRVEMTEGVVRETPLAARHLAE